MTSVSRRRLGAAGSASALLLLLGLAGSAAADPVTVTDPGGSGAKVTISDDSILPGQTISISGTGFNRLGGAGEPLVAIKPYDLDPLWAYGGTNAVEGEQSEAHIWFNVPQPAGSWSGTITPAAFTARGLAGGSAAGTHWLRILSGAFSTDGSASTTVPITFRLPFTYGLSLGLTGTGGFQAGTTFRPGTQVVARGDAFTANSPVTAALDGAPVSVVLAGSTNPVTTTAGGALPAETRVVLPADAAVGARTLTLTVAGTTATVPIRVTPAPDATVATAATRPGGRFAFSFKDFVGVGGAGQKVAVVATDAANAEQVLACVTAAADGTGRGTAVLPAGIPTGAKTVRFNAGLSCKLPPPGTVPVTDDLPGASLISSIAVAADAPLVSAPASTRAGEPVTVSLEGFGPSEAVQVKLGAATLGALTTDASGKATGPLTVPAGTPVGQAELTAAAGSRSAVTLLTVDAAPAPVEQPPATTTTGTATTPPPPTTTTPAPPVTTTTTTGTQTTPPAAPPKATAPKATKLAVAGRSLRVTLSGAAASKAKVTVRTARKVKVGGRGRAKLVTLASGTTAKTGRLTLKLTAAGRKVLKAGSRLQVKVTVTAAGRTTSTATLTLRP